MSEGWAQQLNTKFAFELETTENTAATDDAGSSITPKLSPSLRGVTREMIERDLMLGHIGKMEPIVGGYPADLGYDASFEVIGSGTQHTAPPLGQQLQTCGFTESVGASGTIAASPTPTTTGLTVTGGTVAAGHMVRVEVSSGSYEYARVLTHNTGAVTLWPPLTAIPATGGAVQPGVAYIPTSTHSAMKTGTAFFYFDNGVKIWEVGCRGNVTWNFEINQPVTCDLAMAANGYGHSQTAIGYTYTPNRTIEPPIVLGITVSFYYDAEVSTSASTTSVPLRNVDNSAGEFEVTANSDYLIVDVGSSVYETKLITGWTYATQTATVATLGGTPSAGNAAYIKRTSTDCLKSFSVTVEQEWTKAECMQSTYGYSTQLPGARTVTLDLAKHFRSDQALSMLEGAVAFDIMVVAGSTTGNIHVWHIPYIRYTNHEIDLGSAILGLNLEAGAYASSVGGNDEIFYTSL